METGRTPRTFLAAKRNSHDVEVDQFRLEHCYNESEHVHWSINAHASDGLLLDPVAQDELFIERPWVRSISRGSHDLDGDEHDQPADVSEAIVFRMLYAVALQSFCSALIQTDVQGLLMEQFGEHYANFASRQASIEKCADLVLVTAACAFSDRFGRKPLLMMAGGFFGLILNLSYFFLPLGGAGTLTLTGVACLKMFHQASNGVFLAVNGSAINDVCSGGIANVAAANAATQSYTGLSVIMAPQAAVQLRKVHPRAPFAVAVVLYAANWFQVFRLPETLMLQDRSTHVLWDEALNPFGSATLLLRQATAPRLRALCVAYSLVSLTRAADPVLQPFTRKTMRWGKDEFSYLLSFWGMTVFFGCQTVRKLLKKIGPRSAVRIGAPFLAMQEFLKSLAFAWWSLPVALILGLPSAGLEPGLKALIVQEAQRSTQLRSGAVQAALKTQQALTLAALGSPLIGALFTRWSKCKPPPWPAWHYIFCATMALSGGVVHEFAV